MFVYMNIMVLILGTIGSDIDGEAAGDISGVSVSLSGGKIVAVSF